VKQILYNNSLDYYMHKCIKVRTWKYVAGGKKPDPMLLTHLLCWKIQSAFQLLCAEWYEINKITTFLVIALTNEANYLTPHSRVVSWEVNSCSTNFLLLWNSKIRYYAHKSLSLDPVLNQINPVHILTTYISKIYFTLSSHLCLCCQNGLFPLGFPTKFCIYFLLCMLHALSSSSSLIRSL